MRSRGDHVTARCINKQHQSCHLRCDNMLDYQINTECHLIQITYDCFIDYYWYIDEVLNKCTAYIILYFILIVSTSTLLFINIAVTWSPSGRTVRQCSAMLGSSLDHPRFYPVWRLSRPKVRRVIEATIGIREWWKRHGGGGGNTLLFPVFNENTLFINH